MTPQPIDTAPRDGTEFYLVSIQRIEKRSTLVSIHNGYWSSELGHFCIGQPHHDLRIGDCCSTHWLPLGAFDLPTSGVLESNGADEYMPVNDWENKP